MRAGGFVLLMIVALLVGPLGCVTAPERIEVNVGGRPEPVDSSQVPHPATLEAAQQELDKAYANIQYLQRDNERLKHKADNYKHERDDCKKRLKKYEKD